MIYTVEFGRYYKTLLALSEEHALNRLARKEGITYEELICHSDSDMRINKLL